MTTGNPWVGLRHQNNPKGIKVINTIDTIPTVTYTIARSDIETAIARVKKANQRAARIGQPGYTIAITDAEPMPIYPEGDLTAGTKPLYYIEMANFIITGMVPRLGNWEVVALLKDDEHAGVISRTFPGITVDLSTMRTDFECQHCHTNRRRTTIYVLRNRAGDLVKVGKNCLELYTGITVSGRFDSPSLKLDDEMEEMVTGCGNGHQDLSVPVEELLTLAVGSIAISGWMGTVKAREMGRTSTADRVRAAYGRQQSNADQYRRLTDAADLDRVAAVLTYVTTIMKVDGSEYTTNLIACTRAVSGLVSWDNFGLVVSAVASYDRYVEQQARQTLTTTSEWVGTPGQTNRFENVRVMDIRQIASDWSNADLVKMVTESGAVLTWFASKGTTLQVGEIVTITARVKDYTHYRGNKETKITHVKVV